MIFKGVSEYYFPVFLSLQKSLKKSYDKNIIGSIAKIIKNKNQKELV